MRLAAEEAEAGNIFILSQLKKGEVEKHG